MYPRVGRPPVLVMETGANQVAGGDVPGWVSGTVANLGASASVTMIFDLGNDWDQYVSLVLSVYCPPGSSSGLLGVIGTGSDTAAFNASRRLKDPTASGLVGGSGAIAAAALALSAIYRPMGRYVCVSATNADATNPVPATAKFVLTAFPV